MAKRPTGPPKSRRRRPAPAPAPAPASTGTASTAKPAATKGPDPRAASDKPRKVRALALGEYGNKRQREGDVFILQPGDRVARWMELVDKKTPTKTTASRAALARKHEEMTGHPPMAEAREASTSGPVDDSLIE